MIEPLKVKLGERSYPIHIGVDIYCSASILGQHITGNQIMIVTNTTVAPLYLNGLVAALDTIVSVTKIDVVELPDGEQYKTLEVLNSIYTSLLENVHNRSSTIIALGGGVIGDMAGFAAASYQRGINFIQIPTTLLSMVDSSVGGKTGVNHPLGKNMIGAFYQPQLVLADVHHLHTLPQKELSAGLAEVIKYGIIYDALFFDWLQENIGGLLALDTDCLQYAIKRSCEIKSEIVSLDEREQGVRALLNLGHTFGHAIETGMGYGSVLHGEAVAIGTNIAAITSKLLGLIDECQADRIKALLIAANLPVKVPEAMTNEQFYRLMAVDKKVIDGKLRLVLPVGIGAAEVRTGVPQLLLEKAINLAR